MMRSLRRALAPNSLLPGLCLVILAAGCIGCGSRTEQSAQPSSSRAGASPQLDSLDILVLNRPIEMVLLKVVRDASGSTIKLTRLPYHGRAGAVLDSIGPVSEYPEKLRELLRTFDVWAMNAPNAPGASCRTDHTGLRRCIVAEDDYSIVMRVGRDRRVRVQRYIDLGSSASNPQARALGDFILAWAHSRDAEISGGR